MADSLTPREIVARLDENIVGQHKAKRAVAIALRNRWRRQQVGTELRDEILAIGSGGSYALAAARALKDHSTLSAAEIVRRGLEIAGDICIYTNRSIEVMELT